MNIATMAAPLTWIDIARRLANVALASQPELNEKVRRARLGRYGIELEVEAGATERDVQSWLEAVFPGRVQGEPLAVTLDGPDYAATLPVEWHELDADISPRPAFGLVDGVVDFGLPALPQRGSRPVPIAAAISVKGGTGRTTTAITLALRWANLAKAPVLLVDADLEAPGISYMLREQVPEAKISLEDVIALAHSEQERGSPGTTAFAAARLLDHLIPGSLFVLPLRRDIDDLVGSAIRPEHLSTPDNHFAFADLLTQIAAACGCVGVVVDVRAGLVPLAVNLAMDPEVSPVLVTTLADQSIKATAALVKFLGKEYRRARALPRKPLLVINRVPNIFKQSGMDQQLGEPLSAELIANFTPDSNTEVLASENFFDRFPPAEALSPIYVPELPDLQVSAATWTEFVQQINSSGFAQLAGPGVDRWIETELLSAMPPSATTPKASVDADATATARRKLTDYANTLIAAENAGRPVHQPLVTKPLAALAERFISEVPIAVSEGAKGTGKTLAARYFLAQRTWDEVVSRLVQRAGATRAPILPVCASIQSSAAFQAEADEARRATSRALGFGPPMLINATTDYLKAQLQGSATEQLWTDTWLDTIAWSAGFNVSQPGAGARFAETLRSAGQTVVAVLEGLEELYISVGDPNVSTAMRAALVNLVQRLRAEPKRPIGLVVFARRDTIEASVRQNIDQFRREYQRFALSWTDDDILDLAAWLATQAGATPDLWTPAFNSLAQSEKTLALERLWGRKLGPDDKPHKRSREAYTATWIIAVLSDLRARLVPRDLIRLLEKAASVSLEAGEGNEYTGRLLVPRALRAAVEPTSEAKVAETQEEIPELRDIFKKFRVRKNQVAAPLDEQALGALGVDQNEIDILRRHGIVFGDVQPYEVPELFRRGLGLRHTGARRSVVNLYRRARQA